MSLPARKRVSTPATPVTQVRPAVSSSRRELFAVNGQSPASVSPLLAKLLTNQSDKRKASSNIDCTNTPFKELGRTQKWTRINEKLRPELNKINDWLKRDFGIKLSEVNFTDNFVASESENPPINEQIREKKIEFEINYVPFDATKNRKYKVSGFDALKVNCIHYVSVQGFKSVFY
jgi:hypothetical protein